MKRVTVPGKMTGVKNFGKVVAVLLKNLGMPARYLADESGVSESIVHRWVKREIAPRDESVVRVARTFKIPFQTFKEAIEGKRELPAEYLNREKWEQRLAREDSHARALDWFDRAPVEVQRAVLNEVPSGREAEYLRHVNEHFKQRLTGKGSGKKRAG